MGSIKDSLTFDDVTLVPSYSSILPSETSTSVKLAQRLNLRIPLMSSAMDTVTESKMAISISKSGGLGIIHRNFSIEKQVAEVKKVAHYKTKARGGEGAVREVCEKVLKAQSVWHGLVRKLSRLDG